LLFQTSSYSSFPAVDKRASDPNRREARSAEPV